MEVERSSSRLRIEFRYRPSAGALGMRLLFLLFVLAVTAIELGSVPQGLRDGASIGEVVVPIVVSFALLILDGLASVEVLFSLFGYQEIIVEKDLLSISTILLGMRWSQSRPTSEVVDIRVEERVYPTKLGAGHIRRIAFCTAGNVVRTKGNMSLEEADKIRGLLCSSLGEMPR